MANRKSKIRAAWDDMRRRCLTETDPYYHRYGGRGIKICDEWSDLKEFEKWAVSSGMADGLQLDRVDNDGDYTPENCRWTTPKEQATNRSSTRWIEFDGLRLTQRQWSQRIGITDGALWWRLDNWPLEKALTVPPKHGGK